MANYTISIRPSDTDEEREGKNSPISSFYYSLTSTVPLEGVEDRTIGLKDTEKNKEKGSGRQT